MFLTSKKLSGDDYYFISEGHFLILTSKKLSGDDYYFISDLGKVVVGRLLFYFCGPFLFLTSEKFSWNDYYFISVDHFYF